jgi:hypothetical protein
MLATLIALSALLIVAACVGVAIDPEVGRAAKGQGHCQRCDHLNGAPYRKSFEKCSHDES